MKLFTRILLTICFLSLTVLAQTSEGPDPNILQIAGNRYMKAVEIYSEDGKPREAEMAPKLEGSRTIIIDLDLGESEAMTFVLVPATYYKLKVEQQYETSLTVMAEGPHVDLTNWKHYTSPWEALKPAKKNTFISQPVEIEKPEFPKVVTDEIVEAVTAVVKAWGDDDAGAEWIELAKQCKSADEYPCAVSVNQIRLKISALVDGVWEEALVIRINVPMGC